jgi:hypothetical protein
MPRLDWPGVRRVVDQKGLGTLSVSRCLDAAALDPLVLAAVEDVIGTGAQFGNTCAIQVHGVLRLGVT